MLLLLLLPHLESQFGALVLAWRGLSATCRRARRVASYSTESASLACHELEQL